ncbi:unnamed protein product [Urochloa decumbens]|uniref:Uncharacterized protein n=1 Tax=Urochloa decumbens TaxID=240449 RepID=A0ABC9CDZ4_9POAL
MAGVFWGGGRADEVADFDEYDPTPYGGGYDIALTFGRPLPPSEETCYPISTAATSSYDRPQQHGGRRPAGAEETHGSAAGYAGAGGYARRPQAHEEETHGSVGSGYGYGRKGHDDDDEQKAAYRKPKPAVYGDGDEHQAAYRKPKPAYDGDERPSYGRKKNDDGDDSDDDDKRKPRYKKYDNDDSDDDDDDKKKRFEKNNRRRKDYDD